MDLSHTFTTFFAHSPRPWALVDRTRRATRKATVLRISDERRVHPVDVDHVHSTFLHMMIDNKNME